MNLPILSSIDTSGTNSLRIEDSTGKTTLLQKGELDIEMLANDATVTFRSKRTNRMLWRVIVGTDAHITITDGVTPVVYDGTTPGTNDAPAMIDYLQDNAF